MDRMISLIANLATCNRDYVVFVGAGFSKDAGIPSGWEVLLETLKPLYLLKQDTDRSPEVAITQEELEIWYKNNEEINNLGYSQILELIRPGEVERREYIATFFAGKQPGEAHRELAQLVSMGLVRFIFTTNFDDLIEKSLDEYGINYDVIFSDDILEKSKSWDKVTQCRIYKLHGDYKAGGLRNTDSELKSLDPLMSEDFQYIIDRHGIFFIGYSGRDAGVMEHILRRKPYSYPIYWQIRDYPEDVEEYKYFHAVKNKYENKDKRPVYYLENPSASHFLRSIREGVAKLNLVLKISSPEDENFDAVVVNADSKKLRNISYMILEKFETIYSEYRIKENLDTTYKYRFEIFKELLIESKFLFNYVESLLRYDCDSEIEFFLSNIFKVITADLNELWNAFEFIVKSYPYFVIISCGSMILKYDKEPLLKVFLELNIPNYHGDLVPLMSIISYQGDGWKNVSQANYGQNFIYPKYTIIREYLRLSQLSEYDIDYFESYIFLMVLLVRTDIDWFNGSTVYRNSPFKAVHDKYFKNSLKTKDQYDELSNRLRTNHQYLNARHYNSFIPFYHEIGRKFNDSH